MIAAAISQIAKELNQTLGRERGAGEDPVVVSSLVERDGSPVAQAADKLAIFLVGVERDTVARSSGRPPAGAGGTVVGAAPVHLNLLVMFAANSSGGSYLEALKRVARTIAFFQRRPYFDHANTPELDPGIERLVFDLHDLDITAQSNLWGILGGHYVPSVLYRMRMVTIDAGEPIAQVPPVSRPLSRALPDDPDRGRP